MERACTLHTVDNLQLAVHYYVVGPDAAWQYNIMVLLYTCSGLFFAAFCVQAHDFSVSKHKRCRVVKRIHPLPLRCCLQTGPRLLAAARPSAPSR